MGPGNGPKMCVHARFNRKRRTALRTIEHCSLVTPSERVAVCPLLRLSPILALFFLTRGASAQLGLDRHCYIRITWVVPERRASVHKDRTP
eukprot:9573277-Alexandrium_andersonii.AAC.1